MYVSKRYIVLALVVGFCLLPTMVSAERPVKLTPVSPTSIGMVPEMVIPAGPHYLTTWDGTSTAPIDLPADFFFEGSDPVDQIVSLEGDPIGPVPGRRDGFEMKFAHLAEPGEEVVDSGPPTGKGYDTVMIQHQDAVLRRIGSQARVDLTMEDVRLRSVAPVEVTGTETRYYDVFLNVTSHHKDGREANTGYMAYTRDGVATGEFTAEVFAWARYIFVPLDGGEAIIYDHNEQLTLATRTPTPFFIPALHQGRALEVDEGCCNMCASGHGCHCAAM